MFIVLGIYNFDFGSKRNVHIPFSTVEQKLLIIWVILSSVALLAQMTII